MYSKKHKHKIGSKTLKRRITSYIYKKGDICCESDFKRENIISDIFSLYKKNAEQLNEKDNYLDHIANDIVIFIGYRIDLEKNKDREGLQLWDMIDKYTSSPIEKTKLAKMLNSMPLYYLLAFLGSAYYKYAHVISI